MTPKTAFVVVALSLIGLTIPASGEGGIDPPRQTTTTDHVNFAPGGTIRIESSYGDLNVEGWDLPEVEVRVIKSLSYGYKAKQPDQGVAALDRIRVVTKSNSPTELTISTAVPARGKPFAGGQNFHPESLVLPRKKTGGVMLEYEIHVPRNSHLVIHHGAGSVSVSAVAGDVEAKVGRGDILLWLPAGSYSVDAKSKFGSVASDLDGHALNQYLIGERFTRVNPAPSHRLYLRMGFGGITIKGILPESEIPNAPGEQYSPK